MMSATLTLSKPPSRNRLAAATIICSLCSAIVSLLTFIAGSFFNPNVWMTHIIKMNRKYDVSNLTIKPGFWSFSREVLRSTRMGKQIILRTILAAMLPVAFLLAAVGQTTDNAGGGASPAFGSIATPRPINPATDTTNPSARATQALNPYLGSTPQGEVVNGEIRISLEDAIARGLRFNLGLIDS